jgi:hypothetical protein
MIHIQLIPFERRRKMKNGRKIHIINIFYNKLYFKFLGPAPLQGREQGDDGGYDSLLSLGGGSDLRRCPTGPPFFLLPPAPAWRWQPAQSTAAWWLAVHL